MLSILIPIYDYNAFPLVSELHRQCVKCNLEFEILCQDDASVLFLDQNNEINNLENCFFSTNETNFGKSKNINQIVVKAKFDWLLLLDCDTFPESSNFISNYLNEIQKKENKAVFGGLLYESKQPQKEQLLRWIYGRNRESLSIEKRKQNPNKSALTSNLILKKELLLQHPFDQTITKYGYEDLCFLSKLEANKIIVSHIENPVFHLNLETSIVFLKKTQTALENLVLLYNSNKITAESSKIISCFVILKKLKLTGLTAFLFQKTKTKIEANLLSQKPSLFLFDLYKLGFFCTLTQIKQ
ncbi:glycosyltransferase [Flavobacterium gilvum]|uniref:Glycosyl transferase n=1 Tax=Flavobacterium gilvum TaxID=1492737 RepID=A0AAC9I544_9FLAO|nr:glycosyltransferase [Flavobacterium gilvum]AOW09576.1 glycosyl transferase [Flavobacterium gilvum]KFC58996.1 glycosyl transferase [Flavobacterium gilvum]